MKVAVFLLLASVFCLKLSCAFPPKQANLFHCDDGNKTTLSTFFCNGRKDCKDGSDELTGKPYSGEILCQSPQTYRQCLISQKHICDEQTDCIHGVDECFCANGTIRSTAKGYVGDNCFRCLNHTHIVIPIRKLCDGKIDCPDFSDECLCMKAPGPPKICAQMAWSRIGSNAETDESEKGLSCPIVNSQISRDEICNGRNISSIDETTCGDSLLQFRNVTTTKNNYKCHAFKNGMEEYATSCDGKPTCAIDFHREECDSCPNPSNFCSWQRNGFWLICPGTEKKIHGHQICDNKIDCKNTQADEENCPERYYCTKRTSNNTNIHIPIEKYCNQEKDCEDGSDEPPNCTFDCDYNKSIPVHQVCDGARDCEDLSDECVSGCISNSSKFSDEESMIRHEVVLGISLTISSLAVVGNVAMATVSIRQMHRRKKSSGAKRITKLLFLSLSFADLFVAAYTFTICVLASTKFHQKYCTHDRTWRSSRECKALGALFVIGSEQSIFTMTLIAFVRARGLLRPFSSPRIKAIAICLAISWMMSTLLAILPLLPRFEDIFVDKIWYEGSRLFATIDRKEAMTITCRLLALYGNQTLSLTNGPIGSWSFLEELINKVDPHLHARRYGFYSTHSVCLPTLFPRRSSATTAWWYSLIFIVINFLAFVAMMIGYIVVYKARKLTERSMDTVSVDGNQKISTQLQRKVVIILATDFCCWIPVCVMSFVQFSGKDIPTDTYLPIALIVLPINSALNPFLYSSIPDYLLEKGRKVCALLQEMSFFSGGQTQRRPTCHKMYNSFVETRTVLERLSSSKNSPQVDDTKL